MLCAEWVVDATMPAVRDSALVRRYPQQEELGSVLGALLGVDVTAYEVADDRAAEALPDAV